MLEGCQIQSKGGSRWNEHSGVDTIELSTDNGDNRLIVYSTIDVVIFEMILKSEIRGWGSEKTTY